MAKCDDPVKPRNLLRLVARRWALLLVVLALLATFVPEVVRVTLGSNFHTVIEERLYRAAQPSGATLENYIREHGIRTVMNLRGVNHGEDWFDEEEQAARRAGVSLVSVNLSASDKPREEELRKLVEMFDQCPIPMLLHCSSGSDRTGFASACYLLLKTDAAFEEARSQLSLRYGHFPWGRARCLDQVLNQYKEWLGSQGLDHQSDRFRHWASAIYQKDDWPDPYEK